VTPRQHDYCVETAPTDESIHVQLLSALNLPVRPV
jgi:hypothetical protein